MIILHYTGMQFAHEAIHRLCDPNARVSSHYVVLETGSIIQLVPESKRAWHAGVSAWGGDTDINSRSIGIEICNPGHDFGYPEFPSRQIAATITLCRSILTRQHRPAGTRRWRIPTWRRAASRIRARNFPGSFWPSPASVSGPSRSGAGRRTLRPDDSGTKVTELQRDAGRIRLRHRRHRPLRCRHHARSSPPSSAIPARAGRRHR